MLSNYKPYIEVFKYIHNTIIKKSLCYRSTKVVPHTCSVVEIIFMVFVIVADI